MHFEGLTAMHFRWKWEPVEDPSYAADSTCRHAHLPACHGGFQAQHCVASSAAPRHPASVACACSPALPCLISAGFKFLDSCGFPAQISMEVHYKHLYMWTGARG